MSLHPIRTLDLVIDEYRDYLRSEFRARDPLLRAALEAELDRPLFLAQQPFYQAHRSHAYQHSAQIFGKHWKVSYMVLLINLFWLLPWSWLVVKYAVDGAVALTLAYIPLIYVAHYYGAGRDKS